MRPRNFFSAPIDVCLSITARCNLRCKHCCTNVPLEGDEMSLDQIVNILDQLKAVKVFRIQVMGGEPFVRKDVFDILKAVKQKKFALSLNTNCTLINDKIIDGLKGLSIGSIATSLDGSCPETHDRLRGDGAFEKTVRGIKKLVGRGIKVSAEAVVTRININDLVNIAGAAKKIGVSRMVFVPIFHGGQARCFVDEIAPDAETYGRGIAVAKELKDRYGDFAGGAFVEGYERMTMYRSLKPAKGQKANTLSGCGAGDKAAAIRSDGELVPCSGVWDKNCGSLLERPFLDLWRNSRGLNEFRALKKVSLDEIKECSSCGLKFFCTGNCRGSAFYYSGSVKGFSPDCNYFADLKNR